MRTLCGCRRSSGSRSGSRSTASFRATRHPGERRDLSLPRHPGFSRHPGERRDLSLTGHPSFSRHPGERRDLSLTRHPSFLPSSRRTPGSATNWPWRWWPCSCTPARCRPPRSSTSRPGVHLLRHGLRLPLHRDQPGAVPRHRGRPHEPSRPGRRPKVPLPDRRGDGTPLNSVRPALLGCGDLDIAVRWRERWPLSCRDPKSGGVSLDR